MEKINIGKFRGLQELSNHAGLITVLALDQRGSLFKALGIEKEDPKLYEAVRDFKLEVTEHLLPHCSAILLDPEYSAAEAVSHGLISGQKGLVVATEETGYIENPDGRENRVISNWSLEKAKRMGASAAKLLSYYNPNNETAAKVQEEFIAKLVDQAKILDFPLLLEPMSYSNHPDMPKNSAEFAKIRPEIVRNTAIKLGSLGVDLLKLEFPCDVNFEKSVSTLESACIAISEAAPVPWLLLSAGVDFSVFKEQLQIACRAGASGFVAGRAIWKEATALTGTERIDFLRTTAVDRTKELVDVVNNYAQPWTKKYRNHLPVIDKDWHSNYAEF